MMQDKAYASARLGEERNKLWASLLYFTRVFYLLRTGRKFELSTPDGRESHYITIFRALIKVMKGETTRLIINVPPRYGKTETVIHFIAWALSQYPDSNFLYVSYSLGLAKKQTKTVRDIISMPEYRDIFGILVSEDTSAQGNFETSFGGTIYAAGSGGEITGRGAGIQGCDRFGGAIIIDDIHKPAEVSSDTMRDAVKDWYYNTLQSRLNDPHRTPIIVIGQRLHEDDLIANLYNAGGWESIILPALDGADNALHPQMHSKQMLHKMQDEMPYEFAAQYQQNPQPSGGGIFKPEWFDVREMEPEIIGTFITIDTAETSKDYNDATVFSFWGAYRILNEGIDTGLLGLHWLACEEIRIEPKDLPEAFRNFYVSCLRHPVKVMAIAVEKKSTGVTLLSLLQEYRGVQIIDIERTKASGSKTTRFLSMQSIISSKRISLPYGAKHTKMCIDHMKKITANNTHAHDDICDTLYDAVKLCLMDGYFSFNRAEIAKDDQKAAIVMQRLENLQRIRGNTNVSSFQVPRSFR